MQSNESSPLARRSAISNQIVKISGPKQQQVLCIKPQRMEQGCVHGPSRTKTYTALAKQIKFNNDLNPSILDYYPDFGFVDNLNSEYLDRDYDMWRLLYDQVKEYPKFERIRNLIYSLSMEKYNRVAQQLQERAQNGSKSPRKRCSVMRPFSPVPLRQSVNVRSCQKVISKDKRNMVERYTSSFSLDVGNNLSTEEINFRQ